jgi:hypothetical protein
VIALQRKLGEVKVYTDAVGAIVEMNGKGEGKTPLNHAIFVRPGRHELVVRKQGFVPVRRSFSIRAGESQAFNISISR